MGLGILALGFILLEGITIGVNAVKIFPDYMSYAIVLIGLLMIRKRVKLKSLDYTFILGLLIFTYQFVTISQLSSFIIFLEMLMRISFYSTLFYGISLLVQNQTTTKRMKTFLSVYIIIMIYLLIVYMQLQPAQDIVVESVLGTILLMIKTVLCYMVAYRWYIHNQELIEQYENISVKEVKPKSKWLIIGLFVISIGLLVVLQEPFLKVLENSSKEEYMWYGELDDRVIVEGMWIENIEYIRGSESSHHSPVVWINEDDYRRTTYYSLTLNVGNEKRDLLMDTMMENQEDPNIEEFYGEKDGYKMLTIDYINYETNDLYDYRHSLSIDITLYNQYKKKLQTYHVPLYDCYDKMKSYHYEDATIKVEDLLIYEDFIMQSPTIVIKEDFSDNYLVLLSTSEKLGDDYIDLEVIGKRKKDNNQTTYQNQKAYSYLPRGQNYYLHIASYKDNVPHVIRTIRLEQ